MSYSGSLLSNYSSSSSSSFTYFFPSSESEKQSKPVTEKSKLDNSNMAASFDLCTEVELPSDYNSEGQLQNDSRVQVQSYINVPIPKAIDILGKAKGSVVQKLIIRQTTSNESDSFKDISNSAYRSAYPQISPGHSAGIFVNKAITQLRKYLQQPAQQPPPAQQTAPDKKEKTEKKS